MVPLDAWSTAVEQLMCMDVLVKLAEIGNVVRQLDVSGAFCARIDAINFFLRAYLRVNIPSAFWT